MLPKGFKLGFSLSGFQSEMGVSSVDSNSDWWSWVHDRENIRTGIVSGDLPEDGVGYWDLFKQYHKIAADLGMNAGRLGIEWTRLFPRAAQKIDASMEVNGDDIVSIGVEESALEKMDGIVDRDALKHYQSMFSDFKDRGMYLVLNVFHWPLPLVLHDPLTLRATGLTSKASGWLNHQTVLEFVKYAAYIAWKFNDFADRYSIMNEPNIIFGNGFTNLRSGFPPCYPSLEAANLVKKHLVEACGRSYEVMKKFTSKPVGLTLSTTDIQSLTPRDEEAAEKARLDDRYSFLDALVKGDFSWWPNHNGTKFSEKSEPVRADLKGKVDWIGVNYYTRALVRRNDSGYSVVPGYGHASTPNVTSKGNREVSDFGWEVYPEGLYNVIKQNQARYNLPMMVTENGIADSRDRLRPSYLLSHVYQLERAVRDGAKVEGYLHWSLMDNYEWTSGFGMKFGLVGVDLKTKKPMIRPSALVFRRVAESNGVPNDMLWMTDAMPNSWS